MGVAGACVSKLLDLAITLSFHISLNSLFFFLDTSFVDGSDGSESKKSKWFHMNVKYSWLSDEMGWDEIWWDGDGN